MADLMSPKYTALLQALPSPILASTSITNTNAMATTPFSRPSMAMLEGTTTSCTRQRRARTRFDDADTALLAATFAQTAYPDYRTRKELAEKLGVTEARIAVWFQNRRTRVRKAHCLEPGTPGPHSGKSRNVFSATISDADADTSTQSSLNTPRNASMDTPRNASMDTPRNASMDLSRNASMDLSRNASTSFSDDASPPLDLSSYGSVSRKRSLGTMDNAVGAGYERRVKPRFEDVYGGVVFPSPEPEDIEEDVMCEAPLVIDEGVTTTSEGCVTADEDEYISMNTRQDIIVIAPVASIYETCDSTVSSSQDHEYTTSPGPFGSSSPIIDPSASTSIDSGRGTATPRESSPSAMSPSPPSGDCQPLDLSVSRDHHRSMKMPSILETSLAPYPMMYPPSYSAPMLPWINRVHYGVYLQALRHMYEAPRFASPVVYPEPRR